MTSMTKLQLQCHLTTRSKGNQRNTPRFSDAGNPNRLPMKRGTEKEMQKVKGGESLYGCNSNNVVHSPTLGVCLVVSQLFVCLCLVMLRDVFPLFSGGFDVSILLGLK
jgi:hypothetical protein